MVQSVSRNTRLGRFGKFELLEARNLLAADPVITEFMARNEISIKDGDNIRSDWIELFNAGDEAASLAGWYLTDSRNNLRKWSFPAVEISPNQYLLVFASGQESSTYRDASGGIHTNFRLSADGEYLALVSPNGSVKQEFGPRYAAQTADVSFGYPIMTTETELVGLGSQAAILASPNREMPINWTDVDFEVDANWLVADSEDAAVTVPIGFDHGETEPSLVAYWGFDDEVAADSLVLDLRDAHRLALPASGVQQIAEGDRHTSPSIALDGTSSLHVDWHDEFASDSFTFSAWVNPDRTDVSSTLVANRRSETGGDADGFRLHIDRGRWAFTTGDGSAPWNDLRGPSARAGEWTHLAIRYDASTQLKQLFVNGSRVVESTRRFSPNQSNPIYIGSVDEQGGFFSGQIDEVAFFSAALSEVEIRSLMKSNVTSSASGELADFVATDTARLMEQTASALIRIPFDGIDKTAVDQLFLEMQADDGFAVYLNGSLVASLNTPETLTLQSRAIGQNPRPLNTLTVDISTFKDALRSDRNVLSIHALNFDVNDEDFLSAPRLVAASRALEIESPGYFIVPSPGQPNGPSLRTLTTQEVHIASAATTFTDRRSIELDAGGSPIYYTVDGSVPDITSRRYSAPFELTETTQLRARVIVPDAVPGPVMARTFLKLDGAVAEFSSQLPIVVIDNRGAGRIPNAGWNQTNSGIRQVPRQSASLTIFEPSDESAQMSQAPITDARIGIRVRGAFSSSFPQPGYSVEAWSDDRDVDSAIPILGMAEAADWVFYAPNPEYDQTLIDNSFMFELSNQVGHWAPEVRYVEVFLNTDGDEVEMSDRVGLFAIVEKVERAEDRLDFEKLARDGSAGGWLLEINRMDSITEDGMPPKNFHTAGPDGILRTAGDLNNSSSTGDDIPRQYNAYINFDDPNGQELTQLQRDSIEGWFREMEDVLYGRADVEWNDPINGYHKYIDVDNFIDYMHFNNLSFNGDGLLISMWLYNPDPNNGGKLKFGPIWDVDLGSFSGSPTASLMRNKDRLWYRRLFDDPDFEQRYTDRWFEMREGPLADANMLQAIEFYREAIGAEAARRDGVSNWPARLSQMETWVTRRAQAMDAAFRSRPEFNPAGGTVSRGSTIDISTQRGVVYYTIDRTDPRVAGGGISPAARAADAAAPLIAEQNFVVTARTFDRNRWSAPVTASFEVSGIVQDADLNRDGRLNEADVQQLCLALRDGNLNFDLNDDQQINLLDLDHLLEIGWNTTVGDANLDGKFDSTDLVQVFVGARYEQGTFAPYSAGDWNCDGRFDSSDLVAAFMKGTYIAEGNATTRLAGAVASRIRSWSPRFSVHPLNWGRKQ